MQSQLSNETEVKVREFTLWQDIWAFLGGVIVYRDYQSKRGVGISCGCLRFDDLVLKKYITFLTKCEFILSKIRPEHCLLLLLIQIH